MNKILQFKPIVEKSLTLLPGMFDITYMYSIEGIKHSYWASIAPTDMYKKYFKGTSGYSDKIVNNSANTISRVVSAKLITIKDVEVTITFNITGNGSNGCSGSVENFSPTSIMVPSDNQFDGHLTAESFIITPHSRYDGSNDLDESYYSYYATVAINSDLQSFFEGTTVNTNTSESKHGTIEYSTSVTFTTKKSEVVTVYLKLNGYNGACGYTFKGVSPQWIDVPGRPRLLKYGSKLIKIDIPTFYVWANEGGYHFADGKDPHPFFYEPGMTWRQWVASAYNPSPEGIYIRGNQIIFDAPYITEIDAAIQDSVKPDDVIDPNHHYWLSDE